ncbi:plasma serine protease inhibitor isoform X1 [Bos mutus]|uniref:plasma serine protease inhibitor isoform X1 n=2 Tax=Bos mutus TaxID=72004 RepID=UPI0038B57741
MEQLAPEENEGLAAMRLCLFLCLVLLGPRMATLRRSQKKKIQEVPPAVTTAPPGSRDFVFDLYRALAAAAPAQNIFFSPLSITVSLAMLSLGAQSNTKAQILEGLGICPGEDSEEELHSASQRLLRELQQPQDSLQLSLGNALFTKPRLPIQEAFLGAMRTLYLADTFPTNFEDPEGAKKKINDYVAKQTKGKIVDLIKSLDGTQVMVMVNYIFFKAKWETSFNLKSTHEQDFYVTPETVVRVPMMKQQDQFYYLLDRNLSCKVVGVPYQGNATAFFILPREGEMEQVENGLKEKTLKKWLRMPMKRRLELYLPKFSIEGSYQLEEVLPKLGIRDIFTSDADLTGISNHSSIRVSEMVHKAVVEVDESGTQAAAATGMVITFKSARLGSQRIVFNRPFLVLIVKNSKHILFLGKVTRP